MIVVQVPDYAAQRQHVLTHFHRLMSFAQSVQGRSEEGMSCQILQVSSEPFFHELNDGVRFMFLREMVRQCSNMKPIGRSGPERFLE